MWSQRWAVPLQYLSNLFINFLILVKPFFNSTLIKVSLISSESVRVMFIVCVYLYCCSKYQKGDRLNCLMIWGERLLLFVLMILVELLRSLIKLTFINVLLKNGFTNIRKLMNKLPCSQQSIDSTNSRVSECSYLTDY
jgi:hypothetical protein